VTDDGANDTKGNDSHDDHRLQVGFGGNSQQGVDTEQGNGESNPHAHRHFSLFVGDAGNAVAQPRVLLKQAREDVFLDIGDHLIRLDPGLDRLRCHFRGALVVDAGGLQ